MDSISTCPAVLSSVLPSVHFSPPVSRACHRNLFIHQGVRYWTPGLAQFHEQYAPQQETGLGLREAGALRFVEDEGVLPSNSRYLISPMSSNGRLGGVPAIVVSTVDEQMLARTGFKNLRKLAGLRTKTRHGQKANFAAGLTSESPNMFPCFVGEQPCLSLEFPPTVNTTEPPYWRGTAEKRNSNLRFDEQTHDFLVEN